MNQDHVVGAAVTGAPSATVLLANVLQHFQGIDATTSGSEAALLILALGALAGLVQARAARRPAAIPAQSAPVVWTHTLSQAQTDPPKEAPAAAAAPAMPPAPTPPPGAAAS